MEIKELNKRSNIDQDKKLKKRFDTFEKLINELKKRSLASETGDSLNNKIEKINSFSGSNKQLSKHIRKSQFDMLKVIEKELKLVPKNHYLSRWMAIGMAVFGVPFGMAFGTALDNMAFLGIGIPIGMVVGMAIGAGMDKKALEEGRQLDLEI